jgi:hypothetical protein
MHAKVTVRFPDAVKYALIVQAAKEGKLHSDLVREAVEQLLDRRGVVITE